MTETGCHPPRAAPRLRSVLSFQPQHSHLVIQQLLGHLDANSKSAATVRAGIVEVLSEAAVIAASGSVGEWMNPSFPSIPSPFSSGEEVPEVWAGSWCAPPSLLARRARSHGAGGVQHPAEAAAPQH